MTDEADYQRRLAAIGRAEAKARAALALAAEAERRPERVLKGMTGAGAAEAWEAASLHTRRAVIDHLASVVLRGSGRSNRPFDPARDLVIVWR